jgi:hypothetical protein
VGSGTTTLTVTATEIPNIANVVQFEVQTEYPDWSNAAPDYPIFEFYNGTGWEPLRFMDNIQGNRDTNNWTLKQHVPNIEGTQLQVRMTGTSASEELKFTVLGVYENVGGPGAVGSGALLLSQSHYVEATGSTDLGPIITVGPWPEGTKSIRITAHGERRSSNEVGEGEAMLQDLDESGNTYTIDRTHKTKNQGLNSYEGHATGGASAPIAGHIGTAAITGTPGTVITSLNTITALRHTVATTRYQSYYLRTVNPATRQFELGLQSHNTLAQYITLVEFWG